ncbi:FtsK/SpoIIIE family protein [Streptomyces sp. FR-008]|nr:FtsK/SpoIIIE family protein [Streptomyces sp. FR-008]
MDAAPPSHLAEYVPMSNAMDHHVHALADLIRRRTPPPDVTTDELRARNWWSGPSIYVAFDDYNLVSTSGGNPLAPLTELLPFACDVRHPLHHHPQHCRRRPLLLRTLHSAHQGTGRTGRRTLLRPERGRHPRQRTPASHAGGAGNLRHAEAGEPVGADEAFGSG